MANTQAFQRYLFPSRALDLLRLFHQKVQSISMRISALSATQQQPQTGFSAVCITLQDVKNLASSCGENRRYPEEKSNWTAPLTTKATRKMKAARMPEYCICRSTFAPSRRVGTISREAKSHCRFFQANFRALRGKEPNEAIEELRLSGRKLSTTAKNGEQFERCKH